MHSAGIDAVDHVNRCLGCLLFWICDGGVEMAAALEIVEKVALAFIQQIVVERVLLVDRDFFFQETAA